MSPVKWTWVVPPEAIDGRADKKIHAAILAVPGPEGEIACSRSQLQQLMEEGRVKLDGAAVGASSRLIAGRTVSIDFPDAPPSELVPEAQDFEVLYEDADLVVINKPQGLTVHPSPTQETGTLVHRLLHRYGTLAPAGGAQRPGIVHRIDKNTSGAIVLARTDVAYHALVKQFAAHSIDRAYWALAFGAPAESTGKIEGTIARSPADRKKMAMNVKGGKPALTRYRTLRRFGLPHAKAFASWLELRLETGRTHQIRVHLTALGHSILGDAVYGTPAERNTKWLALPEEIRHAAAALPGQALHARTLGFLHPTTGERVSFEAEPPMAFKELLARLEARYS